MVYEYPPSPHTILPRIITDQYYRNSDVEMSPTTPTSTQQSRTSSLFKEPPSQDTLRLLSRRRPAPDIMRVSTDVPHPPNPSSSSTTSSPASGPSKPPISQSAADAPSPHHFAKGVNLASRRRQSRFDPMSKGDDELDDEGYGELGQRHPLRRVTEEEGKQPVAGSVSLPGIKALFGVAGSVEQPPTPFSSVSLFSSPSLPALVPTSPSSSPSTARTSRYSSLGSSASAASETFHAPPGWWAPSFDPSSPRHGGQYRAHSFTSTQAFIDEHADKRRRSDGPPALRDAEESARLRWQAQSRNASFPSSGPSTPGGSGLRSLLHPPPASSAMSRQSISGSSGLSTPLSPFLEHPSGQAEFPFDRRTSMAGPAPAPSRSASIVGGQLASSFAGLTATERDHSQERRSPSTQPNMDMPPPLPPLPDRRPSAFQHTVLGNSPSRSQFPAISLSRPPTTGPDSRRQSVTRPPSPDQPSRPGLRRSSLTEIIIAKTGDDVSATSATFAPLHDGLMPSVLLQQSSSPSEPGMISGHGTPVTATVPLITGWQPRRISPESNASAPSAQLASDTESHGVPSHRGRKRGAQNEQSDQQTDDADIDMHDHDPGMRGMEVLAESARRVSEAGQGTSGKNREKSPCKITGNNAQAGGAAGPKYICEYCAKVFTRPSSLRIHKHSHTGERPFVCEVPSCRRRFSVQSNLKRHAKVHHTEGISGGPTLAQAGPGAPRGYAATTPLERTQRPLQHPGHPGNGAYYQHHPIPQYGGAPFPHVAGGREHQLVHTHPAHAPLGPGPFGGPRVHPPPAEAYPEEEWEGEEDELDEEDELEEEEGDE